MYNFITKQSRWFHPCLKLPKIKPPSWNPEKPSRDCRNSEPAYVELVTRLCGWTSNKATVSIQVQTRGETKYTAPKPEPPRQRSKLPNPPPGVNCSHPCQIPIPASQAKPKMNQSPALLFHLQATRAQAKLYAEKALSIYEMIHQSKDWHSKRTAETPADALGGDFYMKHHRRILCDMSMEYIPSHLSGLPCKIYEKGRLLQFCEEISAPSISNCRKFPYSVIKALCDPHFYLVGFPNIPDTTHISKAIHNPPRRNLATLVAIFSLLS